MEDEKECIGIREENEENQSVKDTWKSWMLCMCASYSQAISTAAFVGSSSLYFVILLHEFGRSKAETAWVGSISLAMCSFPGPLAAYLSNKYGSRRAILIGIIMSVSGLFLSSFAPNLTFLIITFSIIGGAGGGFCYTISFTVVTKAFDKHQSLAVGTLAAGATAGFIIFPSLVNYLIDQIGLWNTYRTLSGVCVTCCFASWSYPSKTAHHKASKTQVEKKKGALHKRILSNIDLSLLKISSYSTVTVLYMLGYIGYYIPLHHMLRHAEENGIPTDRTSWFLTYFGIATCVGRVVVGKIVDSFKHIDLLALYISQISLIGTGIASIAIYHNSSFSGFLVFFVAYGVLDAGFVGQQCVIVLKCVGPEHLPMAWGIFSFAAAISISIGSPMGGFIVDSLKSYQPCFYFAGCLMITAGVLLSLVPWCTTRIITTRKESRVIDPNVLEIDSKLEYVTRITCL